MNKKGDITWAHIVGFILLGVLIIWGLFYSKTLTDSISSVLSSLFG